MLCKTMKSEQRNLKTVVKSVSIKVLITCQFIHFCVIVFFYLHSLYRLKQIGECVAEVKEYSAPFKYVPRQRREAVNPSHPDDLSQWTILLGHDTIIPKNVFERSCRRVHQYCADKGKRLQGFQGRQGIPGSQGPIGPPGKKGSEGPIGPSGLVGGIGEEGPAGKNGRCNCSFPDMYVQRIAVPGPPVIKIEEKIVPVPVVVVKEVEVTKLVPFEPTPPGFLPPFGWSPGMPMPNPALTRKMIKTTKAAQITRWKAGMRRTTITKATTGPTPPTGTGRNDTIEDLLRSANDTEFNNETLSDMPTTEPPYTGPPTLGPNQKECRLNAVGIPVLHAESQYGSIGSWMRDTKPRNTAMASKRWLTDYFASPVLYEYENERQLLNKKQKIKYYVDYLASGTGSMIYNGSYFYHRHGSNFMVRYDLESTAQIQSDELPEIAYNDCSRKHDHTFEACNDTERDPWLYNRPHNFVDFAADENGLWLLYTKYDNPHLFVSKIEPDFYVVNTWEIEVNGTELADAFIMCGVIYGLESATDRDTFISFAYDLYRNESIAVDIPWYNPYRGLTMLHYNPVDSRLYFFDNGKLLSVNVRIEEEVFEQEIQDDYYN